MYPEFQKSIANICDSFLVYQEIIIDDKYLVTDYLDKWNSDDPVMVNSESVPASERSEKALVRSAGPGKAGAGPKPCFSSGQ